MDLLSESPFTAEPVVPAEIHPAVRIKSNIRIFWFTLKFVAQEKKENIMK